MCWELTLSLLERADDTEIPCERVHKGMQRKKSMNDVALNERPSLRITIPRPLYNNAPTFPFRVCHYFLLETCKDLFKASAI
jgi:hypothetical protein